MLFPFSLFKRKCPNFTKDFLLLIWYLKSCSKLPPPLLRGIPVAYRVKSKLSAMVSSASMTWLQTAFVPISLEHPCKHRQSHPTAPTTPNIVLPLWLLMLFPQPEIHSAPLSSKIPLISPMLLLLCTLPASSVRTHASFPPMTVTHCHTSV